MRLHSAQRDVRQTKLTGERREKQKQIDKQTGQHYRETDIRLSQSGELNVYEEIQTDKHTDRQESRQRQRMKQKQKQAVRQTKAYGEMAATEIKSNFT